MPKSNYLQEELDELLSKIQMDTPAEWGIMTPHHLMEHLSLLFAISNGKLDSPAYYPEEKLAKAKKGFFEDKRPFIRNFDPSKSGKLQALRSKDLEEAKVFVAKTRDKFFEYHTANPEATPMHPVMGPLTQAEWEEFHRRHISYHFEQFGLAKELSA